MGHSHAAYSGNSAIEADPAAMRYLGDRKALMSVYYDDRVTVTPETDRSATQAFALSPEGSLDSRWRATGWTTRLFA